MKKALEPQDWKAVRLLCASQLFLVKRSIFGSKQLGSSASLSTFISKSAGEPFRAISNDLQRSHPSLALSLIVHVQ
jgi:hypothetical protein